MNGYIADAEPNTANSLKLKGLGGIWSLRYCIGKHELCTPHGHDMPSTHQSRHNNSAVIRFSSIKTSRVCADTF